MLRLMTTVLLVAAAQAVKFQIINKETGPVWIGIQGYGGHPALEQGGFALDAGQTYYVEAPEDWAGRFWARSGCNTNTNTCLTGDCGSVLQCAGNPGTPPASFVEINLNGQGIHYYNVSLIEGFNLGVSIEPVNGHGDGSKYSCQTASCLYNFNSNCPQELQLTSSGVVVGCKSACLAFNTDQYCCRGQYNQPQTCQSGQWPTDYAAHFKQYCPDAFSYFYDNQNTFSCQAQNYIITFGGAQ